MSSGLLLSIRPEEVTFAVELQKPAYCNVIVINNSKHYVAFKVKPTSPEKYFVRPNTGVLQPWDTCIIMVTLQAQKELPPDLECKDEFVIQSTKLPWHLVFEDIPPDLFNKDDKKVIEECKLRVSYVPPRSGIVKNMEELINSVARGPHILKKPRAEEAQELQRLQEELASTLQQNKLLQLEINLQSLREKCLCEELASTIQQNKLLEQKMEMQSKSSLRKTNVIVGLSGLVIGILLICAIANKLCYGALVI